MMNLEDKYNIDTELNIVYGFHLNSSQMQPFSSYNYFKCLSESLDDVID